MIDPIAAAFEMTGETKDKVLEVVRAIDDLDPEQRKLAIVDLLDRLCVHCGAELPKFDECTECGALRFEDAMSMARHRALDEALEICENSVSDEAWWWADQMRKLQDK